jgi:catechol 2,3-dioxygenase-like lactoylglutathione lyase family enzyme
MRVMFVAGVAAIGPDPAAARRLYLDGLGLRLSDDDYPSTSDLPGVRHFGLWALADAAEACFGQREWPADIAVPQATIEFELESPEAVTAGARELEEAGHRLLHGAKTEPWGQTVARLLGPEGLVIGLSFAPWYHEPIDQEP